jgi:alkylation response protein AidB-like acyl-CoA dehydrogenase
MDADPVADPPERAQLRATLRRLIDDVAPPARIHALDEAEGFDDDLYASLAGFGAFAVGAPADACGTGDVRDQLVVVEELGAGPTSMAAYVIAHYAVTQVLAAFGGTEAHRALLDDLVAGRAHCSFALSEPAGGTDVARVMQTRATRRDGAWHLHGQKMWTSGATMASHIVVLARTTAIERSPISSSSSLIEYPFVRALMISASSSR